MAKWTGVITNAGNSLLNAWAAEKTLHLDCAKAGTGTVEIAALMAQTDLVSQKQDASIMHAEAVDGGIRLKLRVTASNVAYLLNQFGVWASVDGNTSLIAIFQNESGVSVPSIDESPDFSFTFYALIMTSNTGTWTVNIDTSGLVNIGDVNKAIEENTRCFLPVSGGSMTGAINMDGKPITGLSEPKENNQAANKGYVDLMLPKSGGEMIGALGMGGNKITGMAEPEDSADAATKAYVDGKRFTAVAIITTDWTGDSVAYYNTVAVTGILETDTPHITPVYTNAETVMAEKEAWGMVTYAISGDGSIIFVCYEDKPTVAITIQIEVIR